MQSLISNHKYQAGLRFAYLPTLYTPPHDVGWVLQRKGPLSSKVATLGAFCQKANLGLQPEEIPATW